MTSTNDSRALARHAAVLAAIAALAILGGAVRSLNVLDVFRADGVHLTGDGDAIYHVLRAGQLLRGGDVWFDAGMDYPRGARILWPPGFDAGIAALATGLGGGEQALERAAAGTPVLWGIACVGLLGAAALVWFGARAGLVVAFLAAVLPIDTWWGILGRSDHHVAEQFWFVLSLVTFERAANTGRARWIAALGVALGAAPWFWQGAVMYVLFLAGLTLVRVSASSDPAEWRPSLWALGWAALLGTLVFAGPVAVTRPPWFLHPSSLAGISVFFPAVLLLTSAWCLGVDALLVRGARSSVLARTGAAVAAAAVPAAVLSACFPGVVHHGLRALLSGDPFWASVAEARPLLFSGASPLREELASAAGFVGPVILAPVLAVPTLARRLRARAEPSRSAAVIVAAGSAVFVPLAFRSARFLLYAGPFAMLSAALLIDELRARFTRRAVGLAAVAVALAVLAYPGALYARLSAAAVDDDLRAMLVWLRPRADSTSAVLAPWAHGHAIRFYADKPVILTPFGTDIGDDGLRDFARFLYARDARQARAVIDARHVRFVLLDPVASTLVQAWPFAPPGTAPIAVLRGGPGATKRATPIEGYELAVGPILEDYDGAPDRLPGREALLDYRLIYETRDLGAGPSKLFEVVPGARVAIGGLSPGDRVRLELPVQTNQGRRFLWWTETIADDDGVAHLRQPYRTGVNGAVLAGESAVSSRAWRWTFAVDERDVVGGHELRCTMRGGAPECGLARDGSAGPHARAPR